MYTRKPTTSAEIWSLLVFAQAMPLRGVVTCNCSLGIVEHQAEAKTLDVEQHQPPIDVVGDNTYNGLNSCVGDNTYNGLKKHNLFIKKIYLNELIATFILPFYPLLTRIV